MLMLLRAFLNNRRQSHAWEFEALNLKEILSHEIYARLRYSLS